MATEQERDRVAQRVRQLMTDGLCVSAETLFFAESTFGFSPEDLFNVVTDPDSEEREVLLQLIFFPDRTARIAIEPLLGDTVFDDTDETDIGRRVLQRCEQVKLCLPENKNSFYMAASRELAEHFVAKLYLCRTINPAIGEALGSYVSEADSIEARILLRCGNIVLDERATQFLCLFIREAAVFGDDFHMLFEFIVGLLKRMPGQTTIADYLLAQREIQKKKLKDIMEFERKLDQYGMEYLLMQRFPIPHESEEMVVAELEMYARVIDEICRIPPPVTHYAAQENLGSFDPENDLQKLIRILS